jgi:hypothetical protein
VDARRATTSGSHRILISGASYRAPSAIRALLRRDCPRCICVPPLLSAQGCYTRHARVIRTYPSR